MSSASNDCHAKLCACSPVAGKESARVMALWVTLVNLAGPWTRIVLRRLAWRHPILYRGLNFVYRPEKVRPDQASLVIDGFARSGNWFAYAAFVTSQKHPVSVCRHHHAPTVILEGLRCHKPTLLLVREPRSVMVSLLIARPDRTLGELLTGYRDYHALLASRRGQVVVASFDQITSGFGQVVLRINERYGTEFTPFRHTQENVASCFRWLEQNQRDADPDLPERIVAHPQKDCAMLKHPASVELEQAIQTNRRIAHAMRECEELYAAFAETARAQAIGG